MIPAQEWYEYQKQYKKYGVDMQPESDRPSVRQRREEERKNRRASISDSYVVRANNDHRLALTLLAATMIILITVVFASAYTAKLTYEINKTKAENDVIIGEIEDMDVELLSSSTITYIENEAKSELGMKSAGTKNCVYISNDDVPEEGFANILKEKAYD